MIQKFINIRKPINVKESLQLALKYPKTASLITIHTLFRKLSLKPSRSLLPPRLISIFISEYCNCKCPMCLVAESMSRQQSKINLKNNMDLNFIKRLISEFKLFKPHIFLTGGEPLLNRQIIEIVEYLTKKRIITTITTNGLLLEKYAKDLVRSGASYIVVSLDGPRDIHDNSRGVKGVYDAAIKGILAVIEERKKLNKNFPKININTVINKDNIRHLDYLLNIAQELEIDGISFQNLSYYNDSIAQSNKSYCAINDIKVDVMGAHCNKEILTKEQLKNLKEFINKIENSKLKKPQVFIKPNINSLDSYYNHELPCSKSNCYTLWDSTIIRGTGDVELCVGYNIGNIFEKPLLNLWNNKSSKKIRYLLSKHKVIPACFRCCSLNFKFKNK